MAADNDIASLVFLLTHFPPIFFWSNLLHLVVIYRLSPTPLPLPVFSCIHLFLGDRLQTDFAANSKTSKHQTHKARRG
jgi:hypothetical protein